MTRQRLERLVMAFSCIWAAGCAHGIPWAGSRSPAPEAVIREVWLSYIQSKGGRFAANAGTPSPLWVAPEQTRWPMYDLAGFYLPDKAVPEVLSVRPTISDGEYEIVTRFLDPNLPVTALTMSVYAVRDGDRWLLANALPRKTATWRRETVGQITYFVEPGLQFNASRAGRAAAFVDSLASAFGLPRVTALDYYVTSSVDAALRILGVELTVKYGPNGGFAKPVNHQIFSGIPALGEDYRHELTHEVLRPLGGTLLASEGAATWFGGTAGADFPTAVRDLSRYLADHPAFTLDTIMVSASVPQAIHYTSGAVLCAMLADVGGASAIKEFLLASAGSVELREVLTRRLQRSWPTIVSDWRVAVTARASRPQIR